MFAHGGGVLVPPNVPERLAAALERLLTDPPYREELGAQALVAFKDHFSWGHARDQYDRVVRRLLL
jgi:glycosyltransferase involved in cell wall biosynthesis